MSKKQEFDVKLERFENSNVIKKHFDFKAGDKKASLDVVL